MLKLAIVVSHPIQHFCPQYVSFANHPAIQLKVFFGSNLGLKSYVDRNFRTEISWGNLNLEMFDHVFLNGDKTLPSDSNLDAITLVAELNQFNPSLVIIYGYFQKLSRRARTWALNNNVKLAYISDSELKQKRSRLKGWLKSFFVKGYLRKIDFFLSVGDSNEKYYLRHGVAREKILRMHFPIDVEQYRASFANRALLRDRLRASYGIDPGRIVLVVVGKLVPWKCQDHLIDALKILEADGIFMDLFIVGSGAMEEVWKQEATQLLYSKVFFTGFVTIEELPAYYASSDIYVHSAEIEPHSIAVSEAIFMGLPVIISDRCGSYGPSDDVQENKNGFVYKFGDVSELSEKIRHLAGNQSLRHTFGEFSRHIGLQNQRKSHQGILDNLIRAVGK